MNKVLEIGRTTKDIELRYTATQKPVVTFSIAVKRTYKNANGEYDSDFINCVAYGNLAECISKYVGKGDLIGVDGRLQTRNYTDNNGTKHYITEVIVDDVEFLTSKNKGTSNDRIELPPELFEDETDPFDLPL